MSGKGNSLKKIALVALKALVSGILLTYLFRKIDLRTMIEHFRDMNGWYFTLSSLASLCTIFLASLRWRALLSGSQPISKLFSLNLIGSFFNNFLPGAVGGDAVKAYYLYREIGQGGRSIASVFMDRYMGYTGLLTIGLISGAIAFNDLRAVGMQWITPLLFAAFLGGSLLVFGLRIGRRFSTVADFYDYFHGTLRNRRAILAAYGLSLLIQLLTILSIYLITLAVGQRPQFTALFVFVPIIVTVMMLPISISGLGLRESAFVVLFGLVGISAEASTTISILWFLSIAAPSLIGLVEYARYKRTPAATP
ncbi:MAG: flippase-like domain-containing protein [Nitrospirota bacterium]|nr:flippase-like domain-containing protein [Nitrospirota bacterium]